ncbi:hypothetical protein E2C01_032845 [Portunus trituberculatus]|uniref:Uncharacterized protein n=1 Tax=Portunus trituberculatus TaxID=210409 RepID=A0A5B7F0P9_PORTR|nr:hypothetical protein [Portunus trituberculatus]
MGDGRGGWGRLCASGRDRAGRPDGVGRTGSRCSTPVLEGSGRRASPPLIATWIPPSVTLESSPGVLSGGQYGRSPSVAVAKGTVALGGCFSAAWTSGKSVRVS